MTSRIDSATRTRIRNAFEQAPLIPYGKPLRVVLATPRRLDLTAISGLLGNARGIDFLAAELDLLDAITTCKIRNPDVLILDANYPHFAAFESARGLIDGGHLRCVAFLDDRVAFYRALAALTLPHTCYFTRSDDFDAVCECIRKLLGGRGACKGKVKPPTLTLISDTRELLGLDKYGLASLSQRELQVMRAVASGLTVQEVAVRLSLAHSTVDNHKSRLMKKLKVKRASQLTKIAIETGLVDLS
jgi:DNA-binding NarL/FixJ family response regulator